MLTNTTRAAETAVAYKMEECAHHDDNQTDCSTKCKSNKYNTDEAAIPLTRYKAKLEECAQLHQQLQSAHEELARLKHQINGQEISSTHAHNEIENLRVLQRMMHNELQTHQIRLRGLLKENDELAAQVHTLQEVCDYQFKCAERDKTNKRCSSVNNKVDLEECKSRKELLSLKVDRYRYSMKEMSDKLYFMTHAQNSGNDFIVKPCVYNLRNTNIDCVAADDETCNNKVNENGESEKHTLLGVYVKASCDLNVEPHPQLLTSLYNICTCHSFTNTTEKEEETIPNTNICNSKRNNDMNECNSLTMVEPPITFAQLAVVEQFLSKPFHAHHSLSRILTGCVHRITLRVEEESNEAGINFFATHLLPHFTSLQHLEIYHVNTTLALRALVESLAVLQVSQNTYKESSNCESENSKITNASKVNTLYLSLPFLSVHDDALQMLFKLLEQREELCKVNQIKELQNNNNTLLPKSNTTDDVEDHINSMQLPLLAMSTLDLSLCKLQDPCTLRGCHTCPHLTCLMLTNCTVLTNSLLHRLLRHLRELSHLDLSGCTLLDHDGVHFINSFVNVKVLRLENVPRVTKITLKHVEVLFSTLTCVRQLHMPLLKCLPLPIRNRALISTPDYFIAPHLQQVALHDMVIDECTLNCFLQMHNKRHQDNSGAYVDNAKESEQLEKKKKEREEEEDSNSTKNKQQGELCILEFVNCTFTNDNALTKLLEVYKSQNTLHTLKLQGCVGLSVLIVHSLPSSLRELNISFTPLVCDKSLSVLVERCPYLESLNLCGSACTTTTTTKIIKDNEAEKGENDKENEIGNAIRECNNDNITEYTLSEVGLRCLLSLTYLHTLNVLQLPSLTNDAIVLLIYSLPALKILYHETVAVSHLLNAKGELECELQTRANYGRQVIENMKEEQNKPSSLTNFVGKSHINNNLYCDNNNINLVNGKSRYCSLQVRRHDNDVDDDDVYNKNSCYMKYKTNSFVPSLDMLLEEVEKTRADEKEQVNNNTTICTLRDLLRYKRPAELMTWNEHQHPAFLINPAALAATSAENITRKFTLSNIHKESTKTTYNYANTCDDDDDIIRNKVNYDKLDSSKKNSINKELQKMSTEEESEHRPISAISLTSNSTVSSSSSSSSSLQEQEIKKSEEEENQVESDSNNAFASISKSGKRVSFIVPEESNHLQINSALHQNDKAMTHARNKARRSKLRQRQNSSTSENSTKLTSTESKDEAISNGKSKIQVASDNAGAEIGPWEEKV